MVRKTHHNRKPTFIIVFGLTMVLVTFFLFSPKFIFAKHIECYTQHGPCPGEWFVELDVLKYTPLLRPLPQKKITKILETNLQVDKFFVYRRLPSTLVVSIQLRKPLGAIGPSSQVLGIADEKGEIFSLHPSNNMPHLISSNSPQLKDQVSPIELEALKTLSQLNSLSLVPLVGFLDHTTLKTQISPGIDVLIDVRSDQSTWYSSLQLILERSKISPKLPARIDLRFTNPIISYN